jgi:tetraprenyl-beta-curcumene synthase
MARAGFALLLANARYWLSTAPLVRAQLRHWAGCARAIDDPALRSLALQKLDEERFNAEVAAMLATLAPRSNRANAVQAIVALEVLYDYLDGLTELPVREALRAGRRLFAAFTDAVTQAPAHERDYYRYHPGGDDGGYLEKLVAAVRGALAQLPSAAAVYATARRTAARCAEAQVREHAIAQTGREQLDDWAQREAAGTALAPREFLAGAEASVLALHALIAAAADERTTHADAEAIAAVYLSISALTTMLDSLIDYELDQRMGRPGYIQRYSDHQLLVTEMVNVASEAATRARDLPKAAHHVMILVGTVAYYTSAPSARSEFARPVKRGIDRELRPLITPTLFVMRAWRVAKRVWTRRRCASHCGVGRAS